MKKFLLLTFILLCAWFVQAQVPGTLSYQGILVDGTGAPVADGSHSLLFKFFKDPSGATRPDEEFFRGPFLVTTYKGMFTFVIGAGGGGNDPIPTSVTDPDFIGAAQFYVEVTADGTIQSPRIKLTSVPYSFVAQSANTMDAANLTGTLNPARIAAGTLDNTLLASGIDAAKLTTGTLPIARIADGAVTSTKITDLTIATGDIADNAITNVKLADNAVNTAEVADNAITNIKLADNAITTAEIADNAVTTAEIGTAGVTDANKVLATDANGDPLWFTPTNARTLLALVPGTNVQAQNVHLEDLASDGSLTGSKVGTGIDAGNISAGTLAVGRGGSGATTLTGALFGNGTGAFTALTGTASQYLRRNAGNTAYEFGSLSLSSGEIADNAITNAKLADNAVTTAEIADDAVTIAEIGTAGAGDANKVLTTDGSGNPQWVANGTSAIGLTASNGLTLSSNNLVLGGNALGANTTIPSGGFSLNFGGTGSFGIASTTPGSKFSVGGNASFGNTFEALAAPVNGMIVQGNAGIGTSTVVNKLDVEGGVAIGTTYSGTNAAPANGALIEGNVGIGTTSPGAKLDVNGTAVFRGYTGINRTTAVGSSAFDVEVTAGAATYGGMYVNGTNATSYPFYGYATAGAAKGWTWINGSTGTWSLNLNSGDRLSVTSAGNVGVGITTPQNKLDVEGGAVIGAAYSGSNTAPSNGLLVEGNVGLGTSSATYPVTLYNSTDARVVNIEQDYAGASPQYGMTIDMNSATGTSSKYGIDCNVSGTAGSSGTVYGLETDISPNGTGIHYGLNSVIANTTTGTGTRYAVYGLAYSGTAASNSANIYGIYGYGQSSSSNHSGNVYGVYGTTFDNGGTGTHYGVYCSGSGGYTGTWSLVSDRKLKKDIRPMDQTLDKLMMLKPSTYYYKTDEFKFMSLAEGKQVGLIAQEVESVFPEVVTQNSHPGEVNEKGEAISDAVAYKGIDYTRLVPVLVKSIQEQQTQIEELKTQVEELKKLVMAQLKAQPANTETVRASIDTKK